MLKPYIYNRNNLTVTSSPFSAWMIKLLTTRPVIRENMNNITTQLLLELGFLKTVSRKCCLAVYNVDKN